MLYEVITLKLVIDPLIAHAQAEAIMEAGL